MLISGVANYTKITLITLILSITFLPKRKKKDYNCIDKNGNTPLYTAVAHDQKEIIDFLLQQSVNMHAKNEHGNTCLHKAMMVGNIQVIKLLIEKGASVLDFKVNHAFNTLIGLSCTPLLHLE